MRKYLIILLVELALCGYVCHINNQTNQKIERIELMHQEIIDAELLRIIENNLLNEEMPCIHNN